MLMEMVMKKMVLLHPKSQFQEFQEQQALCLPPYPNRRAKEEARRQAVLGLWIVYYEALAGRVWTQILSMVLLRFPEGTVQLSCIPMLTDSRNLPIWWSGLSAPLKNCALAASRRSTSNVMYLLATGMYPYDHYGCLDLFLETYNLINVICRLNHHTL